MDLKLLGWNEGFANAFAALAQPSWLPARIFSVDRSSYNLAGEFGECVGKLSGQYWYSSSDNRSDLPAVGDWVAIKTGGNDDVAIIHELLPRATHLARKTKGAVTEAQVIAANIDTVFIITGLDNNFNLRRIERYIALVKNSGAQPVVILNKADLITDNAELNDIHNAIQAIAFDMPVHFISVLAHDSLTDLSVYFVSGKTVTLLGSSGVGKSTLTNYLLGAEQQRVVETRAKDSRGRHTTTRRQLFLLPSGGMLIDTPGMRELQLWVEGENFDTGFQDIEAAKQYCRFNDCTHNSEPGCAVRDAIEKGDISSERLSSHNKMKRELNYLEKRQKEVGWDARLADRKFGKLRHQVLKQRGKRR
jgi:ribosome biogenesis GTPase